MYFKNNIFCTISKVFVSSGVLGVLCNRGQSKSFEDGGVEDDMLILFIFLIKPCNEFIVDFGKWKFGFYLREIIKVKWLTENVINYATMDKFPKRSQKNESYLNNEIYLIIFFNDVWINIAFVVTGFSYL